MFAFAGSLCVNFLVFTFYKPSVPYYDKSPVSDTTIKFFFEYMLGEPGKTLFTINLALLGGMSGALLNIHGICRCLTFYQRGRYKWADKTTFWVWFYCIAAVICVAVTYRSPLDILPLVGQIFTTISFAQKDASKVRLFTLPSPPCWFVYHLSTGNIGGTLNEIFVISSIVVGMIRLDRKTGEKST